MYDPVKGIAARRTRVSGVEERGGETSRRRGAISASDKGRTISFAKKQVPIKLGGSMAKQATAPMKANQP